MEKKTSGDRYSRNGKEVIRDNRINFGNSPGSYSTTHQSTYARKQGSPNLRNSYNYSFVSSIKFGADNLKSFKYRNEKVNEIQIKIKQESIKTGPSTHNNVIGNNYPAKFLPTSLDYKIPLVDIDYSQPKHNPNTTKHNFELGTTKELKISTNQADYTIPSPFPSPLESIPNPNQTCNIKLGNYPATYKTVTSTTLTKKSLQDQLKHLKYPDMTKVNFSLGDDRLKYLSTEHEFYKKLENSERPSLNHIENLKKSHFTFNSESPDYKSITHSSLSYTPAEPRNIENYLKQNHINLGSDSQIYSSSYSESHSPKSPQSPQKFSNIEKKTTNVLLGQENSPIVSSNQCFYKGGKFEVNRLDRNLEKRLKSHNFSIGYQKKNVKRVEGKMNNSLEIRRSKVEKYESKVKDFNMTNWRFGNHCEIKTSTMQDDYKPGHLELSPIQSHLKKHNFTIR